MTILESIGAYSVSVHNSIDAFCETAWKACVGPDQPFLDPRHLKILERAGLVGEAAGILPHYLALRDADGTLKAAVPAFLKTHSRGELGVDWGLPMAHERASGAYYPKLMVEVPLTPWPGPRLLVACAEERDAAGRAILVGLDTLAKTTGARSIQIAYASQIDQAEAVAHGYIPVETTTFTWRSRGERTFEDFKATLSKKGRYRLRAEYENRVAEGLVIKRLDGCALTADLIAKIHRLYCAVFDQHDHAAWLNYEYFEQLIISMQDKIEFLAVWEGEEPIAGLLCFRGDKTISAQHWVTNSAHRGLLFALMYHSYKEAINRGYTAVDYGTIGAHKALRAATPEPLYHAFKFIDETFQSLAEIVLAKRQMAYQADISEFARQSPYKDKRLFA